MNIGSGTHSTTLISHNLRSVINSSERHYHHRNRTGYCQQHTEGSLNPKPQHPPSTADVVFLRA